MWRRPAPTPERHSTAQPLLRSCFTPRGQGMPATRESDEIGRGDDGMKRRLKRMLLMAIVGIMGRAIRRRFFDTPNSAGTERFAGNR